MNQRFTNWEPPVIEENQPTKWHWLVKGVNNFVLGKNTDVGAFTYIQAQFGVTIEDEVQIGSHSAIYSVSTIDEKHGQVVLKKNCRVGSHTVIMPGVTIGENTVVGAHSFVNVSLPANVVAVGCPARVIKTLI